LVDCRVRSRCAQTRQYRFNISSDAPICAWRFLEVSLSTGGDRRDERTGILAEVPRAKVNAPKINEDPTESAVKAVNRRTIALIERRRRQQQLQYAEEVHIKAHTRRGGSSSKNKLHAARVHVNRGDRLLRHAGLRRRKEGRERHSPSTPLTQTGEIGLAYRVPGRLAPPWLEAVFFMLETVQARLVRRGGVWRLLESLESSGSSVARSVPGCTGTSFCATFRATKRPVATTSTAQKGRNTARARAVSTQYLGLYVGST